MATGYENRQPGRGSFAFTGPAPVQTRSAASGASRGAQIVGGRSVGGVAGAVEFTPAGPAAAGLGQFFEELMRPHVERRQQEQFFKGMTEQMSRQAGDEIEAKGGALSKIFGPTSFEEGAIFYRANNAVTTWAQEQLANKDELKKLPPDELSKVMAQGFQSLMTDDAITNQAIQSRMIEVSQTVVDGISKARYKWKQQDAANQRALDFDNRAGLMQEHLSNPDNLKDPAAVQQYINEFLASQAKPEGMDEETWHRSLYDGTRRAGQNGNGYAVKAMLSSGFLDTLPEDDRIRLEDQLDKYGRKAMKALITNDPEFGSKIMELEAEARLAKLGRSVPGGAEGHAQRWRDLNEELKRRTGFDIDLYDIEDIVGKGMNVIDAVLANEERLRQRRWELEDLATRRQWELEDQAREDDETATAAHIAWATGAARTGITQGVKPGHLDILANNDYAGGDYSRIVQAYTREGWVSGLVAHKMQAKMEASIGDQYSEATETAHAEWVKLNKANPAAARAYYGKRYVQMSNFDRLLTSLPPNVAFQRAFKNPAQYVPAAIPAGRRAEAKKEITAAVADFDGWWLVGRTGLNKSSREAVASALHDEVAVLAQNSNVPTAKLVEQSLTFALKNGSLERYGAFAWRNKAHTEPLGTLLGLKDDEADEIVSSVIDQRLRAAGFSDGASGDNYDVLRLRDEKGQPALYISALDDDASAPVSVVIPFEDLKAEATRLIAGQVARVTSWKPNRVMQKVIDANAAEAAKMKPTQDILPVIMEAAEDVVTSVPGYQMGRAAVNRVVSGVKRNNARRAARKSKKP